MSRRAVIARITLSAIAPTAIGLVVGSCGGATAPPGGCELGCEEGAVCRYDACVPLPSACQANNQCTGDQYCDVSASECLPWGIGPGGGSDPTCARETVPGVWFPEVQCEWLGPPPGDAFPGHVNVLATPMVGTFYAKAGPSIVVTSYNSTDAAGASCVGTDPRFFGVLRILDGTTCAQQATISSPTLIASASVAIADVAGDPTPEIVAARTDGGLVAFTLRPQGWSILWQTASRFADQLCNFAGPSIHDLDDDGEPEIVFYGAVYDAAGNTVDESIANTVDSTGTGYLPVVADIDGDSVPELVTGTQLYSWSKAQRRWVVKRGIPGGNGHTAVGDFGTFPANGQNVRGRLDGIAEVVVVYNGLVQVLTVDALEVFSAALPGDDGGGPPAIADFDGDGRAELATAGPSAYHVLDLDCRGANVDPATCPSRRTDGIAWTQPSQSAVPNTAGSSVFDFDGDGRAEAVHSDQCFTRIYDGATGGVLASRQRTSCTLYESPVVVDADADFNAELITTSNASCGVTCPALDPLFDGASCADDSDCPIATRCGRDQPGDPRGRCRCAADADCGGDGYVCRDPIAGPAPAGKVCRAAHPASSAASGVRVLADAADRWTSARTIWNQHAFALTNIDDTGAVPRTSQWPRNWTLPGLNNFRQNAPAAGMKPNAGPDLTVKQAKVTCDVTGPMVTAEVCNRGSEPVGAGVPVAVYAADGRELRCAAATGEPLAPAACTVASCVWTGAGGSGVIVVDDGGAGRGIGRECREDNNELAISVVCLQ